MKIIDNTIELVVNEDVYSLEAVYGASFVFVDRVYVYLDKNEIGLIVRLKGKKVLNEKELDAIAGEFMNELLNYSLRVSLAENNKKIRELIVSQAICSAVGVSKKGESGFKYEDDPLGIAIPWEDKYGKNEDDKNKI